jgi:hypothetical protein
MASSDLGGTSRDDICPGLLCIEDLEQTIQLDENILLPMPGCQRVCVAGNSAF